MNDFVLYQQLCGLEAVANRYRAGKDCAARLHQTTDRIASQMYRVAVIGEFKRGKSSLINAIIGAEVLPTDILPMTAAITRVTYGEKRSIHVYYKDGRQEEHTLQQLMDFATKSDVEKEKKAQSIREIEVRYPSVFCKNHIDILDTPGLNDNASMTEVTLSILGDVDAAIMVVSAREPISLTEQDLILKLIKQKGIRHIVFAVTHIDAVSNRKTQQDRIIQYIRDRLAKELLEKACTRFADDAALVEKAKTILSQPDIFGVSSVLAIEGFIHDDLDLLEESRFPVFKQELLGILTAAQSEDVRAKSLDAAEEVKTSFPMWVEAEKAYLSEQLETKKAQRDVCAAYMLDAHSAYDYWAQNLVENLGAQGIHLGETDDGAVEKKLRQTFIRRLSAISEGENTEPVVRNALQQAAEEAFACMQETAAAFAQGLYREMKAVTERLEKIRDLAQMPGLPAQHFLVPLEVNAAWIQPVIPAKRILVNTDVMPYIRQVIRASYVAWMGQMKDQLQQWQTRLRQQIQEDIQNDQPLTKTMEQIQVLQENQKLLALQSRLDEEELLRIHTLLNSQ